MFGLVAGGHIGYGALSCCSVAMLQVTVAFSPAVVRVFEPWTNLLRVRLSDLWRP
jgi:hypothetical protein